MNKKKILQVNHLSKSFGDFTPLKDISFDIYDGDVVSIIGPSGVGKSTILRCINRLEEPTSGEIALFDKQITNNSKTIMEARKKIGMVFQNFNLFNNYNVIDNITKPQVDILHKTKAEAEKHSYELLESIGLQDKAKANVNKLSGGQKQRVAIMRAISINPALLLLDEPTSALDPSFTGEVLKLIRRLATNNMTMIVVTHEMQFAKNVSNRVLYIDEGIVYEEGSPDQIFNNPKKQNTISFIKNMHFYNYAENTAEFDYVNFASNTLKMLADNDHSTSLISKCSLALEEIIAESLLSADNKITHIKCNIASSNSEDSVDINISAQLSPPESAAQNKKADDNKIIDELFADTSKKIINGICKEAHIKIQNNSLNITAHIRKEN